ncbi:hypothetical protein N7522_003483 [Penicillium canescens]|nr:hypothetical protein N7522_003483 [Penicillium canescens]
MSDSDEDDWQQVRTYTDHLGHRVVLEQFVEPDFPPDDVHLIPFQVYSFVPLDDDHEQLREYLMQSFIDEELKPLFEIYSYCPPDAFACIEHNRREIAHRKQLHRSGVENPPPLIRKFPRRSDGTLGGFCILIRSHSYRLGQDEDRLAEAGEGPDLLYFNRSFSSTRSDVDEAQRISEYDDLAPEAFELATERITKQFNIGQILMLDIFLNTGRPSLQYALDVDEGEPPNSNPPPEEQIRDQLGQEASVGGFSLNPAFQISHDDDIVTVTNTPKGSVPDIQYVVHALFLASIRDTAGPSLLESTARLFTAAVVSYLPANKTLDLKFYIPNSPSWSAIRPAQAEVLAHQTQEGDQENPFPIGALHTFSAGDEQPPTAHRFTPQRPGKYLTSAKATASTPFRLFTVALDRAKFISEAGVYFYMADFDASGDPDPYLEVCPDDTQIFRGVDMSTVAGRLGLVVLDG